MGLAVGGILFLPEEVGIDDWKERREESDSEEDPECHFGNEGGDDGDHAGGHEHLFAQAMGLCPDGVVTQGPSCPDPYRS